MKGLQKSRAFLLSAVAGFFIATSIWLLFFNNLNLGRRSVAVWMALFLSASSFFLWINKTVSKFSASIFFPRRPWLQAVVLMGVGYMLMMTLGYVPAAPLFLLPTQSIYFNTNISGNPLSSGNVVEIHGIQNGDAWVSLNQLNLSGDYQVDDASVFLLPSSTENILRIKVNQQIKLYFRTRPDGGVVEIQSDGHREVIDLYSDNQAVLPWSLPFPVPNSLYFLADIIYSLGFGYGLFLATAMIYWGISKVLTIKAPSWLSQKHDISLLLLIYFLYFFLGVLITKDGRHQQIAKFILLLFMIGIIFLIVEKLPAWGGHSNKKDDSQAVLSKNLHQKKFVKHPLLDYLLILIPLTPIVQYLLNNIGLFDFSGAVKYLGFFILICLAFAFLPSYLLSPISDRRFVLIGCLSYLFVFFSMPSINQFMYVGNIIFKIFLLVGYLMGIQLFMHFLFRHKAILAHIFSIVFFIGSLFPLTLDVIHTDKDNPENDIVDMPPINFVHHRPDIFLLVYESYSDAETLAKYGIDNSGQFKQLENYGFTLYPGVWTVDFPSIGSIGKLFAMSNSISSPRYEILGNSAVHQVLRNNGYQINSIIENDFFFTGNLKNIRFDHYYPEINPDFSMEFAMQILEGEFDDRILFDESNRDEFLREKRHYLTTNFQSPQFLYSHNNYPGHTPPNVIVRDNFDEHLIKYKNDLMTANAEMIADVEMALANNPNAIIILAGDHGPALTGDVFQISDFKSQENVGRLNILDRYGILLAIRWPQEFNVHEDMYDVKILQDLFPLIFSELCDDPSLYEELRVFPEASVSEKIKITSGVIHGGKNDGEPLFQCASHSALDCHALFYKPNQDIED